MDCDNDLRVEQIPSYLYTASSYQEEGYGGIYFRELYVVLPAPYGPDWCKNQSRLRYHRVPRQQKKSSFTWQEDDASQHLRPGILILWLLSPMHAAPAGAGINL